MARSGTGPGAMLGCWRLFPSYERAPRWMVSGRHTGEKASASISISMMQGMAFLSAPGFGQLFTPGRVRGTTPPNSTSRTHLQHHHHHIITTNGPSPSLCRRYLSRAGGQQGTSTV